jgi:uncharacterized protein (DUF983 family)
MTYKLACPGCGERVSRQRAFLYPRLNDSCRACGTKFRVSAAGWIASLMVLALEVLCYEACQKHLISRYVGIALVLLICVAATWLLPYFAPVVRTSQATQ